jgi:hypothetical protein
MDWRFALRKLIQIAIVFAVQLTRYSTPQSINKLVEAKSVTDSAFSFGFEANQEKPDSLARLRIFERRRYRLNVLD